MNDQQLIAAVQFLQLALRRYEDADALELVVETRKLIANTEVLMERRRQARGRVGR